MTLTHPGRAGLEIPAPAPELPDLFIPGVTRVVAPDADHTVWEAARMDGVGGSDVAAACGINQYVSPYRLWAEKTGRPVPPRSEKLERAARWGHLLEPIVRDEFQFSHPEYVVTPSPGTLAVTGMEWQRVNVDGLVWTPDGRLAAVYEGKIGSHYQLKHWENEDEVPVAYTAQVQWAMFITGAPVAWVVGLLDSHTYLERLIVRDDDLIAELVDLAAEFWSCVVNDVPPPIDGSDATKETLARVLQVDGSEVELDPLEWAARFARVHEINGQIAKLKAEKEAIGNEVRAAMGPHTVAKFDGQKVATHKTTAPQRGTDYDRLLAGWPDAYNACVTNARVDPTVPLARRLDFSRSKDAMAKIEMLLGAAA